MARRGQLRLSQHTVDFKRQTVEVWYDGQFIATVTVAEEAPIVRIISKRLTNSAQVMFDAADSRGYPPIPGHVDILLTKR